MIGFLLAVLLLGLLIVAGVAVLVGPWRCSPAVRIGQIEADTRAADEQIESMTRQSLQAMRQAAREQQRAQRPRWPSPGR